MSNIKLYFVRFDPVDISQESFYKFGITQNYDVLDRFNRSEYNQWAIKVMASAYGPRELVEQAERDLLNEFPKNFWLMEKISGVTEIVKLTHTQIDIAMNRLRVYSSEWYDMRHN